MKNCFETIFAIIYLLNESSGDNKTNHRIVTYVFIINNLGIKIANRPLQTSKQVYIPKVVFTLL
jgi:hypothetical protein